MEVGEPLRRNGGCAKEEPPNGCSSLCLSRKIALDLHHGRYDAEQAEGQDQRAAQLLFLLHLEHHDTHHDHGQAQQHHGQAGDVQHVHLPQQPQQQVPSQNENNSGKSFWSWGN